jgi:uncharacterized protein YndB with AHSA1/START domain
VKIVPKVQFTAKDAFGDAAGNINPEMPQSVWEMNFEDLGDHTLVQSTMKFPDLKQLEQTIAMGFKEGLTMAMENLDKLIETKQLS